VLYQAIVGRDLLASPLAQRACRAFGLVTAAPFGARLALWSAAVMLIEIAAIGWIDRPLATYFREHDAARPFFAFVGPFGLALPQPGVLGSAFGALRWGGAVPRFEPWAGAASRVVMGAHYLSDVIMGGFIGIAGSRALATAYARGRLPFRLAPSPAAEPVLPPGE